MKRLALLGMAVLLLSLVSCGTGEEDKGFVSVRDGQFILKGESYYYFGANFWHGAYLGADLVKGDKERLLRELDLLKEHRITNLRVMAATELSDLKMSVKPAFMDGSGSYNEELLEGLDFLLVEMARRDMKAVLVLNNYWQWSGGMAQHLSWSTGEEVIDPDMAGDWPGFMAQSARFYGDEKGNKRYQVYIATLINRINTLTGTQYKDDPTIMSWQLANEPRPAPDSKENAAHAKEFVEWVHATSAFIHQQDPNHLVSTGSEGLHGSVNSWDIYMDAHGTPDIDYVTFHIWPKNWGWFDATNPDSTYDQALANTLEYFGKHVLRARELNKPTVLEEFGMERDGGSFSREAATTYRDRYLNELFAVVVDSARAGSPMAGLNFWAWGGEGIAGHEDYIWRPGDTFVGDPPQEPQGLNSVFSEDLSTLAVFKKYNQALEELQ